jgi:hypothetical protein
MTTSLVETDLERRYRAALAEMMPQLESNANEQIASQQFAGDVGPGRRRHVRDLRVR